MYSAPSKAKLEAAATVAAVLLLAGAPIAALAAIERHEAHRALRRGADIGSPARPASHR